MAVCVDASCLLVARRPKPCTNTIAEIKRRDIRRLEFLVFDAVSIAPANYQIQSLAPADLQDTGYSSNRCRARIDNHKLAFQKFPLHFFVQEQEDAFLEPNRLLAFASSLFGPSRYAFSQGNIQYLGRNAVLGILDASMARQGFVSSQ